MDKNIEVMLEYAKTYKDNLPGFYLSLQNSLAKPLKPDEEGDFWFYIGTNLLQHAYRFLGEKTLEFAIQKFQENSNKSGEGIARLNFGGFLIKEKEYERGFKHLDQSMKIAIETKDYSMESGCLGSMGMGYLSQGDSNKALEFANKALKISLQSPLKESEAKACSILGLMYSEIGEHAKALEFQERTLRIQRNL